MRNATSAPIKRTNVEKRVNTQIVFLFVALLALSLASTIGSVIRTWFFAGGQWYLSYTGGFGGKGAFLVFLLG